MPSTSLPPASDTVNDDNSADSGTPPPASNTIYHDLYVADVREKASNTRRLRDVDNTLQALADENKTSDELQVEVWEMLDLFNPGPDSDDKAEDSSGDHEPEDEGKTPLKDRKLPNSAPEPTGVPRASEESHEAGGEEKTTVETPCEPRAAVDSAHIAQAPKKSPIPSSSLPEDESDAIVSQQEYISLTDSVESEDDDDPEPSSPAAEPRAAPDAPNVKPTNQPRNHNYQSSKWQKPGHGSTTQKFSQYTLTWTLPNAFPVQCYAAVGLMKEHATFFHKAAKDQKVHEIPPYITIAAFDSIHRFLLSGNQIDEFDKSEFCSKDKKYLLVDFCLAADYFGIYKASLRSKELLDKAHDYAIGFNGVLKVVNAMDRAEAESNSRNLSEIVANYVFKHIGKEPTKWDAYLQGLRMTGTSLDQIMAGLRRMK